LSVIGWVRWLTAGMQIFSLQLFFMMSRHPSPGAGDNLNSTSMIGEIAKHFREERSSGLGLKQTRLIVLSTDGEEIGQRGAIEYVREHHSELHAIPTYAFNMDSVYYYKDLTILTRDRNHTCKLSMQMVADIYRIAEKQDLKIRKMAIPFGGGGTDAAAFAKAGIHATSIIAQPTGLISNDHLYHTSKDEVERIDPKAVGAAIQLAIAYIKNIDEKRSG
jgi:aminopeptidase YwaD